MIKIILFSENKNNIENLREIEALIWEIEDHPLNLIGKDVGNINITHLIDLNDQTKKS